ncbi:M48 family metallopeptidase [Pseudoalteromonas sp. SSDWG2]|uniref:M48 family metallopeptidase n=1 Tax=Pseudoalteromonas sp. SSDWG2 TaxID=3139391 RepID=UPI003BAB00A8
MQNFFAHQRQARRKTWLLVTLFVIAVSALIALAHFPVLWVMDFYGTDPHTYFYSGAQDQDRPYGFHLGIAATIASVIIAAVLYKYFQLRQGGQVIASQLGGEQVQSNTYDPIERQLLNVVEEVAIAARMPLPSVYILKHQPSINAFAAGYHTHDSVIAVTQGAITQLTRDQLQAVIAHEFSHIRHGDVRLNARMSALLFGITFIGQAGESLIYSAMRASSRVRNKGDGAGFTIIVGLVLTIFGWLGTQLGDLIKAMVCRQREFLADAGAAELTRSPYELAEALLVIATSPRKNTLRQSNAHIYSHLFFSNALNPWVSWFSTHPPLAKRIKALDPSWDGVIVERARTAVVPGAMAAHAHTHLQAQIHAQNPVNQQKLEGIDSTLGYLAHEPIDAKWLVMLLCLHDNWDIREAQLRQVINMPNVDAFRFDQAEAALSALTMEQKFTLLEVAIGSLRCLPKAQQKHFIASLDEFVKSHNDMQLNAWAFYELTVHALMGDTNKKAIVMSKKLVVSACEQLFNALASFGHTHNEQQKAAFDAAAEQLALPMHFSATAHNQVVRLHRALLILKALPSNKKQALIKACKTCIEHDNDVNEQEQVLLFTLAACLNVDAQAAGE